MNTTKFSDKLYVSFEDKPESFYRVDDLHHLYNFVLNQMRTSIKANALNANVNNNIGRRRLLLNIRRALRDLKGRKLPLHVTNIKPSKMSAKLGRFYIIG